MNHALKAMLLEWLVSGTDIQRIHAQARLGLDGQSILPIRTGALDRPTVKQVWQRIHEIKKCVYWHRDASCGCDFGRCRKYDRATSYHECDDCLMEGRDKDA